MSSGIVAAPAAVSEHELYRNLLAQASQQGDMAAAAKALELSIQATQRAQLRVNEYAEVAIGDDGRFRPTSLRGLQSLADVYAKSEMVPSRFRGKPADCAIAINMAQRLRCGEFEVFQNMYVVHGTPGFQGRFYTALLNRSGIIRGRVEYTFGSVGDSRWCEASATDATTGVRHVQRVDWGMVVKEGWNKPKGDQTSKWMTMPDVMFQYRAGAFLVKINFPEVSLGMPSVEELEDQYGEHADGNGPYKSSDGSGIVQSVTQEQVLTRLQLPSAAVAANADPVDSAKPKTNGKTTVNGSSNGAAVGKAASQVVKNIQQAASEKEVKMLVEQATNPALAAEPLPDSDVLAIRTAAEERMRVVGKS